MTLVSILNLAAELAVYCGPEFRSNRELKVLAGTLRAAGPYLVNGVADGQHVGAKPLELPAVFLHQGS